MSNDLDNPSLNSIFPNAISTFPNAILSIPKKSTEILVTHAEPYELKTDVGVKYSAKGEIQPEATVQITRHLQNNQEISDLIRVDLNRGVEEVMFAVQQIFEKNKEIK